jgi:hypothetical protein
MEYFVSIPILFIGEGRDGWSNGPEYSDLEYGIFGFPAAGTVGIFGFRIWNISDGRGPNG